MSHKDTIIHRVIIVEGTSFGNVFFAIIPKKVEGKMPCDKITML